MTAATSRAAAGITLGVAGLILGWLEWRAMWRFPADCCTDARQADPWTTWVWHDHATGRHKR